MSNDYKVELSKLFGAAVYFNSLMLPSMFDMDVPEFHKHIYRALDDDSIRLLVVQMPRGFGKTTILQGFVIQQVVNLKHPVIVYMSDTYTQAELHTEAIKEELASNDRIRRLYGKQVGKKWSAAMWTTAQGVTVLPRGSNQSIRGVKVLSSLGNNRPSLVVIDDPENDENCETQEQRNKLWSHLFAVVRPMMKGGKHKNKIVYLGTPINQDAVLIRLINLLEDEPYKSDPSIKVIRASARDKDGRSVWPSLWSDDRLAEEERFYRDAGQIDTFYREYMGQVISPKEALFPQGSETYYSDDDLPDDLRVFMSIDVAFTTTRYSDYCAVVVFATSAKAQAVYVLDAIRKRLEPDKFLRLVRNLYSVRHPVKVFTQKVVVDDFFKFYSKERGLRLPFETVSISRVKNSKVRRIASLEPLYSSGRLRFKRDQTDLLLELWSHPRSQHDDASDALATGVSNVYIPWWTRKEGGKVIPFNSIEAIRKRLRKRKLGNCLGLQYHPDKRVGA